MFRCQLCHCTEWRDLLVDEVFQLDGKRVLVEHIPARACARCGDVTFSRETTEAVRRLVHAEGKPAEVASTDVLQFG